MSKTHLLEGPSEKLSAKDVNCAGKRKEAAATEQSSDQFVMKTLDQLELPCRYSVVYELTRIECLLNQLADNDQLVPAPLKCFWSISA